MLSSIWPACLLWYYRFWFDPVNRSSRSRLPPWNPVYCSPFPVDKVILSLLIFEKVQWYIRSRSVFLFLHNHSNVSNKWYWIKLIFVTLNLLNFSCKQTTSCWISWKQNRTHLSLEKIINHDYVICIYPRWVTHWWKFKSTSCHIFIYFNRLLQMACSPYAH